MPLVFPIRKVDSLSRKELDSDVVDHHTNALFLRTITVAECCQSGPFVYQSV
jgi:hypothetical protein